MRVGEFAVLDVVVLEDRHLFAVAGEIRSGSLRAGLLATLTTGGEELFRHPIHGVEVLDGVGQEGKSYPALTFSYSSPGELESWKSLDWAAAPVEVGTG